MISIIIPVYNVERHLEKCLISCFQQSYDNIEIIAINDGSTDRSGLILDKYASIEKRLKIFHQPNSGVVITRNRGITYANGEWLMFVDSDDYIPVNAVENLYNLALRDKVDICTGIICIKRDNRNDAFLKNELLDNSKGGIAEALLTEKIQLSLCAKIFRSSLFDNIVTDASLKIGEDAYVLIQVCDKANQISTMNEVAYYYYQRSESTMNHPSYQALLSRLRFIELTIKYYKQCSYSNSKNFMNALDFFVIKESFAFLRMGGEYSSIPEKIIHQLNNRSLNNKILGVNMPLFRIMMLKFYRINPMIGNIYRYCFVKLRLILK